MIEIKVEKKRYWDVAQVTDMVELYPGRKRMIQAMKELGPLVESAGDQLLNENIKLTKDLAVFFPAFQKLFHGFCTPIRGFDIKFKEKYYVDINCFYDYNSDTLYSMPLSFLPELSKRNKNLHDIIVKCVNLMKWKGVSVIENPYYDEEEMILENMSEYVSSGEARVKDVTHDPDEDKILAAREFLLYKKHKNRYVNKVFQGFSDRNEVKFLIDKFNPSNSIESKIIQWCNMVLDAANEPNSIQCFCERARENFCEQQEIDMEDIFNDGQPVEIDQVMRFTWFGCAGYLDIESQNLGEMGGNFGQLEFANMYECHSKEDIDAAREKFLKEWGLFPEKLAKLLEFGSNMVPEIWDYIDCKLTAILD